jgi:VanZ family protein
MKKIKIKKITLLRILLFVLIATWAILVFVFSNQSGEESTGISRMVAQFLFRDDYKAEIAEPYIRKLAHFSEYGLGGVLFMCLFLTYEWSDRKRIGISILFGVWYAAFDEVHQLMVPDRSGNILDVGIDMLGFCTGVIFAMLVYKIILSIKQKKK